MQYKYNKNRYKYNSTSKKYPLSVKSIGSNILQSSLYTSDTGLLLMGQSRRAHRVAAVPAHIMMATPAEKIVKVKS